ncbi:transglycosylase SLT domain-containing protein [Streptomyces sp. CB01881]|uniref:aggregation-promoting factor C-terminal-like domain-containing protein n=1 Tax=Streptomyces sp. CB01881 TaxID=2078691 RepID=UPI000CDC8DD5|nr:transglycosylase SLT domain-containing protein [Streptomyces sp. CB01881]AUY52877.1 transglycosylase domain-containing protein [Streptomyces sp. CB01881]TYC70594.1 lytic transglycosylase domain-containing protein [Streptomyces sp. CB01881]
MQLSHARRNSLITGITTLVVASAATAALAIPQSGGNVAEAAAPVAGVAGVSVDGQPAAEQAQVPQADAAAAQAQAQAQAQADAAAAAAAAAAQAQADAAAAAAQAQAQAAAQTQAAAEAKAQADAKAKADADAAASRSQERAKLNAKPSYSGSPREIAAQIVPAGQLQCFSNIVSHESTWNPLAVNASSGAYGLVQALPGSKMASAGSDWRTNPATQIKWGLDYMNSRYGSPCAAWSFWQAHHWY